MRLRISFEYKGTRFILLLLLLLPFFLYQAKVYTEHQHKVKVARFNPSGYYVASADDNGYVRVWSYTHAKNMIKKASKQLG